MPDELNLDMSKTYIYEGLEYILTGRTAVKEVEPPQRTSRRSRRKEQQVTDEPTSVIMVEIKPVPKHNPMVPNMGSGGQWVSLTDLFVVTDMLAGTEYGEEDEKNLNDSGG